MKMPVDVEEILNCELPFEDYGSIDDAQRDRLTRRSCQYYGVDAQAIDAFISAAEDVAESVQANFLAEIEQQTEDFIEIVLANVPGAEISDDARAFVGQIVRYINLYAEGSVSEEVEDMALSMSEFFA